MKLEDLYPSAPHLRERLPERFWSKVDVRGEEECWPWTGCKIKSIAASQSRRRKTLLSYGRFGLQGTVVIHAHRMAYVLTHGEIDDELFALHSCDNPPCCNPAHLFAGTAKDNAADRDAKGRFVLGRRPRGAEHYKAKFTAEEVARIRRRYQPYVVTRRMLAEEHGVKKSTVDRILDGITWKEAA